MRFQRPRSQTEDCADCYGNGCLSCGMTGRAPMTDEEDAAYEAAMDARADAHREEMMERRREREEG